MRNHDFIENKVNEFYNQSSIYIPNKFSVMLYGPYVDSALEEMDLRVKPTMLVDFNRWKSNHVIKNGIGDNTVVDLKWACKDVNVPVTNPMEDSQDIVMDAVKDMSYKMIVDYQHGSRVSLTIVEESNMLWYQFFNSLTNQFFHTKTLTMRDSIHKVAVRIQPINLSEEYYGKFEKGQVYEFNSVIPKGITSNIKFDQSTTSATEYKVAIECPDPFQKSLKSENAGMKNRFQDNEFITKDGNSWVYKEDELTVNANKSNGLPSARMGYDSDAERIWRNVMNKQKRLGDGTAPNNIS